MGLYSRRAAAPVTGFGDPSALDEKIKSPRNCGPFYW
jgi:hypothetical protein